MPDKVSFEPQPPASSGGVTDVTASSPLASTGGATPAISLSSAVPVNKGGTGATTAPAHYAFIGPTSGADAAPSFRALVSGDLPAISAPNLQTQSLSPPGGSVGFAAELYLGPQAPGYSYASGGAGYLPGCVFASALKRISFRTAAAGNDLTVRLRTAAGVQVYSKLFTAGSTLIDEAVDIAVVHDVLVQLSVEPVSGGPSIDVWSFGWTREITP